MYYLYKFTSVYKNTIIPEKLYIQKVPKEIAKCAIVYYANNKKHYVPIDKIN